MKKIFSYVVLTSMILSTVGVLPIFALANDDHGNGGDNQSYHSENNHDNNHGDDNHGGNDNHENDNHGNNGHSGDNNHGDDHGNGNGNHGGDNNHGDHGDNGGDNTPTCTDNQHLDTDTNTCVDNTPVPPTCTDTQHLDIDTNTCVNNPPVVPTCTDTQHLNTDTNTCIDNTEVPPTCGDNQHLDTENNICVNNQSVETTTDTNTNTNGNSGGSNGGGGNGPIVGTYGVINGQNNNSNGGGQVLGASCTPTITSYLGYGKKNNPDDVKKLQTFLNGYLHLNIPVNGIFGPQTLAAVKQFQLQESAEVLMPWVRAHLMGKPEATGYVYKTTIRRINMLNCSSLDIPIPQLP